ncbi:RhuM family protein [Stenoxybacter acetivorans]|uniref:RhuM family protein n=1 Tax=Stenoxybacter acetivorans TaxID=422441 RepID=UPI0005668790|nr:RhuM family protein [Stenoxybacter acetivorans]
MSNQIIIYNSEDGQTKIELHRLSETVWLSQLELAELFQTSKQNISKHIQSIFAEGELEEQVVVNQQLTTTQHGAMADKTQSKTVQYYNLDMILAIGYRVRSRRGAEFRQWASTVLKEYLLVGASLNQDVLRAEADYFKQVLAKIRDIRSSEKIFYRQVLDIFATSVDYSGKSAEAQVFFKTVQNKMIFAVTGKTAPELIFARLDSDKLHLGLSSYPKNYQHKVDLSVSKNYLNQAELNHLNLLVSAFLDTAELQAGKRIQMTMSDWIAEVDRFLSYQREEILNHKGTVSRAQVEQKIEQEYLKYRAQHPDISAVEQDYAQAMKKVLQEVKTKK